MLYTRSIIRKRHKFRQLRIHRLTVREPEEVRSVIATVANSPTWSDGYNVASSGAGRRQKIRASVTRDTAGDTNI